MSEVLDLAEMGVPNDLIGQVDSISLCPAIAKGRGRVVLTTVSHLNDFVFHLTLDETNGQADTIGITGYHKVYTEDRGWVDADELQQGEYVETADGEAKVDGLVADPGLYRVYNMSVEADHVYYVGDAEALVHNTCSPLRSNMEDNGTIFKYTEDAHHIVAQNDPAMAEARQLLLIVAQRS